VEVEASVDSEWRWTHYELQSRVFIWWPCVRWHLDVN
jgi:hypothetical protein